MKLAKHRLLYIPILLLFSLSFVDCAKKGTPSGGKKDTIPPVIVKTTPENYSINFNTDEIKITFNEYIKLKDINKELIISPPLKYNPLITPLNTSKTIKIKLLDTLKGNTTYSINFGNSIVDNNEGNAYKYYKYVFSTGNYIDSLKLTGSIKDAALLNPEKPISIVLYEVNETFNDSFIYSEKPTYITTTNDTTNNFELNNLKEGKYLLLALKEKSNDYIFQPNTDKIGFINEYITLPTDSAYDITLFKEVPDYRILKPKHESKNHILFPFEGTTDSLTLDLISQMPKDYEYIYFKDSKTDTIHYWFKPSVELDSLQFVAKNKSKIDTLTARMRNLFKDSLKLTPVNSTVITVNDTLKLQGNTPLINFNSENIKIIDKDSTQITAITKIRKDINIAEIIFPKTYEQTYNVKVLPNAITDFFGATNDTLSYIFRTKAASDYGTLSLTLKNAKEFPFIVQLVNEKYAVVAEKYIQENEVILFKDLNPSFYYIRLVIDENANKRWDSGNFLNRVSPEKIIYYPTKIEVRANWDLKETFILE
jgi:hypothetical protein